MAVVARKSYLPHPVEKTWVRDVRAVIDSKPRGFQEQMRKYIISKGLKCSSGELSELLSGTAQTSEFVEPIHEFLGWPPPLSPSAARDTGEIMYVLKRADEDQLAMIDKAANMIAGASGEEARDLIAALLKAFPAKAKNSND